ncbi:ABC transporter transmembrane domain-containing protein [Enterococcus gallinarum]|uniref:ABC transporter transmembrane domain-containing protein n=1 Tax=Enterococcus gallinarum TaxID=1353 RepID=UPI003DA2EA15
MKKIVLKNKKLLVTHVIICAIAALIQVGVALVYSLITEVAMSGNIQKLMVVGLFAFFYILLNTMSDFVPRRSKSILVHSITDQLRVGLSQKIVRMDPEKFLKSEKNYYLSKLANEIKVIEQEFLKPGFGLVLSIFTFIFSLLFSLRLSASFSIVMLLLAFSPLLAPYFAKKILGTRRKAAVEAQDHTLSLFEQLLSGYLTLRVGRGFPKYATRFSESSERLKKQNIHFESLQGLTYAISFGLGDLAYSGTWIIGGFFVAAKIITLPNLIAMTTLMSTIAGPLEYFSTSITDILSSKKVADDLISFIDSTDDDEMTRSIILESPITTLSIANLSYSYGTRTLINELSHQFERGKKYAITGASGSGKSTLLNILAGIYSVGDRQLFINEQEMNQISRDSLYQKVSLVQQKTAIFQTSIASNLSVFNDFELERVVDALIRVAWPIALTTRNY